jgi:hypothetical protein
MQRFKNSSFVERALSRRRILFISLATPTRQYFSHEIAGQTHLNPNTVKTLHDGMYLFPAD